MAQYYNASLVGHVTGWQADMAERQVSFEMSVMAKVAQYYNASLVGHVTGWQADMAKRQVSFEMSVMA